MQLLRVENKSGAILRKLTTSSLLLISICCSTLNGCNRSSDPSEEDDSSKIISKHNTKFGRTKEWAGWIWSNGTWTSGGAIEFGIRLKHDSIANVKPVAGSVKFSLYRVIDKKRQLV